MMRKGKNDFNEFNKWTDMQKDDVVKNSKPIVSADIPSTRLRTKTMTTIKNVPKKSQEIYKASYNAQIKSQRNVLVAKSSTTNTSVSATKQQQGANKQLPKLEEKLKYGFTNVKKDIPNVLENNLKKIQSHTAAYDIQKLKFKSNKSDSNVALPTILNTKCFKGRLRKPSKKIESNVSSKKSLDKKNDKLTDESLLIKQGKDVLPNIVKTDEGDVKLDELVKECFQKTNDKRNIFDYNFSVVNDRKSCGYQTSFPFLNEDIQKDESINEGLKKNVHSTSTSVLTQTNDESALNKFDMTHFTRKYFNVRKEAETQISNGLKSIKLSEAPSLYDKLPMLKEIIKNDSGNTQSTLITREDMEKEKRNPISESFEFTDLKDLRMTKSQDVFKKSYMTDLRKKTRPGTLARNVNNLK